MLNENKNENAKNYKNKLYKLLIATIVLLVTVIASYTMIIMVQNAEFDALDQSLVGETIASDKID